jgi:hypothetical protein
MSVVKSYLYLTKIRYRAVHASLSKGISFAETPDLSSCAVPPSPSSTRVPLTLKQPDPEKISCQHPWLPYF